MKKLLALLIALMMAISMFALAACSGDGDKDKDKNNEPSTPAAEEPAKGTIDGDYTKVELSSESFALITEKVSKAKPVVADKKVGGTESAEATVKLTIGGKALTLTAKNALELIFDTAKIGEGLEAVGGAKASSELTLKSDDGFAEKLWQLAAPFAFGDEAPDYATLATDTSNPMNAYVYAVLSSLNNLDVKAEGNSYVKDTNMYVDGKLVGVPDALKAFVPAESGIDFSAIEAGLKYVLTNDEVKDLVKMLDEKINSRNRNHNDYPYSDESVNDGVMDDDIWGTKDNDGDEGWIDDDGSYWDEGLKGDDGSYWDEGLKDDKDSADLQEATLGEANVSGNDNSMATALAMYLGMLDIEVSNDVAADGSAKIKISTAATTKDKAILFLKSQLKDAVPEEYQPIIDTISISKLNVEIYLELNADGEITAVACNADIEVSATVNSIAVALAVNGTFDCSFIIPANIQFPSFEGYVSPYPEVPAAA